MPLKDPEKRKAYHRRYMREVWYPRNKQKHIGYVGRLKEEVRRYILEQKERGRCAECGFSGKKHPQVLEFDHIEGKTHKKFEIGKWRSSVLSIARVKEEIAKCELVCANCHRIRTFTRLKTKSPRTPGTRIRTA